MTILRKISGGKIPRLFVSIYGDPESAPNKEIIAKATLLGADRRGKKLDVQFFDAASAHVWS
jgi:hypothetical protein